MTLGVSIMAHPERNGLVADLAAKLPSNTPIVWDVNSVVWWTGRRAWVEGIDSNTTHWLVLQDDAAICQDLLPTVEAALQYVPPDSPLSLYVGTTRPDKMRVQGLVDDTTDQTSFLVMNRINWGVGVVIPTPQIQPMIEYCENRGIEARTPYDGQISKWFEFNGVPVYYTWPSLVDHRNTPSVFQGRDSSNRHAHKFIGENVSGLDIDWSGDVVSAHLQRKGQP